MLTTPPHLLSDAHHKHQTIKRFSVLLLLLLPMSHAANDQFGDISINYSLRSQFFPEYPDTQAQVKLSTRSEQAPLLQGFSKQSSMSGNKSTRQYGMLDNKCIHVGILLLLSLSVARPASATVLCIPSTYNVITFFIHTYCLLLEGRNNF